MKQTILLFITALLLTGHTIAQEAQNPHQFTDKHFVGTTGFILFTPFFDPSPEYFQLNYGYRLNAVSELSIEAITWAYQGPLGRPYGPDYEQESTGFPGDVKAFGAGIAYKRLLWKGVFAQVHSTLLRQHYRDSEKQVIQKGFQLFNTCRLGYHITFGKRKRLFIAPSIAITYWPINTNLPDSFQVQENKYPNYFMGEPGLHVGYTF